MNTPKKIQLSPQSSQSGFTIIESLMAILVVTILLVGLAPVLALSVATRVQAKRVALATQAARSYIDGVRSGAIIPPPMASDPNNQLISYLPPSPGTLNCSTAKDYCPPQTATTTNPNSKVDLYLYCIDVDVTGLCKKDDSKDLIIQAFGQIPLDSTGQAANVGQGYRSYRLGVRVYRAGAFKYSKKFASGTAQNAFTGGTGLSDTQYPIVEMSTEIVVTDTDTFQNLCKVATPTVKGC